ncbi:hypothetical protein PFWH6_2420 [Pseudomonas fluorescens WH6]|nr:hypothetical protein PFWH6_2420 [Pseudomonas fluorescens WH6]
MLVFWTLRLSEAAFIRAQQTVGRAVRRECSRPARPGFRRTAH